MGNQLKRLYEEKLVKDIMISTAFCVKDILQDDENLTDDDIYEFIEANYMNVIRDTIEAEETENGAGENNSSEENDIKNNPAPPEDTDYFDEEENDDDQ
ncbi:MAG: hypothetical protein ABIA63_09555 [bacterium]